MASEAKINVATGFNGGVSVSVRADSADELSQLFADIQRVSAVNPQVASLFTSLVGSASVVTEAQAVANVQAAMPGTTVVPQSTVGQPLPQPGTQPSNVVPLAPPTLEYPGDCSHGRRVYVDKQAKGKPWRRWECAVPWSKDAQGRCKPVNVEG